MPEPAARSAVISPERGLSTIMCRFGRLTFLLTSLNSVFGLVHFANFPNFCIDPAAPDSSRQKTIALSIVASNT